MATGDPLQDYNPGEPEDKPQPCKHIKYCGGDCTECDGSAASANLNIIKGRWR